MTRAARRQHRRIQHASLSGAEGVVLSAAASGGFPERPSMTGGRKAGEKPEKKAEKVATVVSTPNPVVVKEAALDRQKRRLVQRGLASLGLYEGFIDGAFGPKTRGAVRAWQKAKGFGETGKLTKEQVDALVALAGDVEREKAERERKAREAAERERLAKEAREREETQRKAREAAERERLAKEAREKAEAERQAKEARERAEAERKAKEAERERAKMKLTSLQRKWPKGKRLRDCPECPELVVEWTSQGKPIAVSSIITTEEWFACFNDSYCSIPRRVKSLYGYDRYFFYKVKHISHRDAFDDSDRAESAKEPFYFSKRTSKEYLGWLLIKTSQWYRIHSRVAYTFWRLNGFKITIKRDLK